MHVYLCLFLTGVEYAAIYWSVILLWDYKMFQAQLHGLWHSDKSAIKALQRLPRETYSLNGYVH